MLLEPVPGDPRWGCTVVDRNIVLRHTCTAVPRRTRVAEIPLPSLLEKEKGGHAREKEIATSKHTPRNTPMAVDGLERRDPLVSSFVKEHSLNEMARKYEVSVRTSRHGANVLGGIPIGVGRCGQVMKVRRRETNELFAMKVRTRLYHSNLTTCTCTCASYLAPLTRRPPESTGRHDEFHGRASLRRAEI